MPDRMWFPEETPRRRRDRKAVGAVALIVVGLVLFGLQFAGPYAGPSTLLVVAMLLLLLYVRRFSYVGLVSGCVLGGLAIGLILDRALNPAPSLALVGLGAGFIVAYFVDLARVHWTHWWPWIPGLVLIVAGALQGATHRWSLVGKLWPLILVVIGVLGLVQWRAGRRMPSKAVEPWAGGEGRRPEPHDSGPPPADGDQPD